ncbi:ATP-binding protein [Aquabacterium sp.]|uniref:ATP-binding protein n=1 Tax=Aquabacterium sp. TaxID=1872578 RepID=UPI002C16841C|nr:winged helix-turn-helix domain-containing protein [Aquabacterium sp.]HSW03070.1 winged helix-turn-helix domain-containing protein [Aquabacterium sp.]
MAPPAPPLLHFGPFTLDLAAARLTRDGRDLALRPKAFELLQVLARRPNQLVSKDELLDAVWGRRFISEGVIKSVVGELRAALDDDPKQPRWIETVPRRGYRFAGLVETGGVADPAPPLPPTLPPPAPPLPGNLPAALPPTIGRDDELGSLAAVLATQRLLTIAGPSGIGKTRLALALAAAQRAAWPDGVWFAELAPLAAETSNAATVCATLTQVLQLGAGAANGSAALARALQPLALLLVLDNAEHLLEALAPLVATLLAQAPHLRIVVTSQEPLRIAGEQVVRLGPLALPAAADDDDAAKLMASGAVRLFVERVAGRLPGFGLAAQQQQAVADICRALDGLPLALELAAARVPVLGVHGIAELLLGAVDGGARLQWLTQGARSAAPRHRTLRDALQWSHGLLDERLQRVFRRLGVFHGGFTLELAQAVCADDTLDAWGVLDAVQALVDKSLLSATTGDGPTPRFTLLESLRAFALERLAQAGETAALRTRHVQAMRAYWQRADAQALYEPALPWLARHLPEIDNLRAAQRWAGSDAATARVDDALARADEASARADDALALVVHSGMLWPRAGLMAEGRAGCEAVRAQAAVTADAALRSGFALALATLAAYANSYPPAEGAAMAQRAADEFEQAGDPAHAYFALHVFNQLSVNAQLKTDRSQVLSRMMALEQPGWPELLTRFRRAVQGYDQRMAGNRDAFVAYCRGELAICRRLGAVAEGWIAAQGLMLAEHESGRVDDALVLGRQLLADIRAAGRLRQHAALFALWLTMLAESGDSAGTRSALAEALPTLRSVGTRWMAHVSLAWLAAREGRAEAAGRLLGWHDAARRADGRAGWGLFIARSLRALADHLEQQLGAPALAQLRAEAGSLGDDGAEQLALETVA